MGERERDHHPAFRHIMPPPGQHSLGRLRQRPDLSPINSNYTRIYSSANINNNEEVTVSSDSDYDTIYSNKEDNNTLVPIGEIRSEIIRLIDSCAAQLNMAQAYIR